MSLIQHWKRFHVRPFPTIRVMFCRRSAVFALNANSPETDQSGDVALVGARFLVHYRTRGSTPLQPVPAMIGFMKLLGLSGI